MTYEDYYLIHFRSDLAAVMAGAVAAGVGHHTSDPEPALQPSGVGRANAAIRALGMHREDLFAVALFYTVLVDQVAFTHFASRYSEFRALTQYPKFRGDCTQACYYHLHPTVVLETVGRLEHGEPSRPVSRLSAVLAQARPRMEREIFAFFSEHLQDVSTETFWDHCVREMPTDISNWRGEPER